MRNLFYFIAGVSVMILNCSLSGVSMDNLKLKLEKKISTSDGLVAVAFEDLKTGQTLFINEKEQMHAASTMKTPAMIEVFKQARQGLFNMSDSIEIVNSFRSIVDSSIYSIDFGDDSDDYVYKQIGKKMSIYDLTYQMITVSSNFATNLLIDLVGAKNVMKTMKSIGANDIQVLRGVEDIKAYRQGLNNTTNAQDMLVIMKSIALKKVVTPEDCESMINILLDQKFNDKIPALLPKNVKVAHKTGSITEIDHDAAIVYAAPDHAYILVVLTKGIKDHTDAQKLIANLSKIIYDSIAK